jgi:two-component system chemotaxis response regulator CheB
MTGSKQIRLLVVDDSIFFRTIMSNLLVGHPCIKVVGSAADAFEARRKIQELNPDVMTLDINMPKVNGIQFLKELLPQQWLPVVVITTQNDIVFEAMRAGAVEFVEKPSMTPQKSLEDFGEDIAGKIIAASEAAPKAVRKGTAVTQKKEHKPVALSGGSIKNQAGLIALGASTGGTEATSSFMKQLPSNIPGMVVVQHMPPVFTGMYAQRLDRETKLKVKEATEGDKILPGHVYIAPGDKHLVVEKRGTEKIIHVNVREKVNGHRPSADVMFDSVAKFADKNAVGIILTGMGADGAKGLLKMRQKGAYTIGQDASTSVVYGMPMVAYNIGAVVKQAPLDHIADILLKYLSQ